MHSKIRQLDDLTSWQLQNIDNFRILVTELCIFQRSRSIESKLLALYGNSRGSELWTKWLSLNDDKKNMLHFCVELLSNEEKNLLLANLMYNVEFKF